MAKLTLVEQAQAAAHVTLVYPSTQDQVEHTLYWKLAEHIKELEADSWRISDIKRRMATLQVDKDGVESDYAHILKFVGSKGLIHQYDAWKE